MKNSASDFHCWFQKSRPGLSIRIRVFRSLLAVTMHAAPSKFQGIFLLCFLWKHILYVQQTTNSGQCSNLMLRHAARIDKQLQLIKRLHIVDWLAHSHELERTWEEGIITSFVWRSWGKSWNGSGKILAVPVGKLLNTERFPVEPI
jgi:hypothetical protein